MDQLSFDFRNARFEVKEMSIIIQIHTFENVYGLDARTITRKKREDATVFSAERLTWAGGQENAKGRASLIIQEDQDEAKLIVKAEHTKKIRCAKIIIPNLPAVRVLTPWEGEQEIPADGRIFSYPTGWQLGSPILFLRIDSNRYYYSRSLDDEVRAKRFAVYPSLYPNEKGVTVEMIFEELTARMGKTIETPEWIIGSTNNPDEIMSDHMRHLERAFGLTSWEERSDVPDWAKEIALIAYIHGQHWTGYIFNDYENVLEILSWLSDRLEPNRILAHIAGWEGRYYWKYGDYRPDPRMGGEEGFRKLMKGAKQLGCRVQLMLGANCANKGLENFEEWGENANLRSAGGLVYQGNKPDWDVSRSHDHGWQAWLNPGCPTWRERLVAQMAELVDEYGIDSIFLDTDMVWTNDPNHPVFPGLLRLRDELRMNRPNLLLAGEGWYDAIAAVTPLVHPGMPKLWPELLGKYCRCFAHNSWGDAGRGSTGVFEGGYQSFSMVPDSAYWIPTAIFVEDTLDSGKEKLEKIIEQAKRYAKKYLDPRPSRTRQNENGSLRLCGRVCQASSARARLLRH